MSDMTRTGTDVYPDGLLLGNSGLLLGGGGTLDARMLQQPPDARGDGIVATTRAAAANVSVAAVTVTDDRQRIVDGLDSLPSYQMCRVQEFAYVYGTSYDAFARVRDLVIRLMSQNIQCSANPFQLLHNTLRYYHCTPEIFSILVGIFSPDLNRPNGLSKPHQIFIALSALSHDITRQTSPAYLVPALRDIVGCLVDVYKLSEQRSARHLDILIELRSFHQGLASRISYTRDQMCVLYKAGGDSAIDTMYEFRSLCTSENNFSHVSRCVVSVVGAAGISGLAQLRAYRHSVHTMRDFTNLVWRVSSGTP